jgi:hypothetical protein
MPSSGPSPLIIVVCVSPGFFMDSDIRIDPVMNLPSAAVAAGDI